MVSRCWHFWDACIHTTSTFVLFSPGMQIKGMLSAFAFVSVLLLLYLVFMHRLELRQPFQSASEPRHKIDKYIDLQARSSYRATPFGQQPTWDKSLTIEHSKDHCKPKEELQSFTDRCNLYLCQKRSISVPVWGLHTCAAMTRVHPSTVPQHPSPSQTIYYRHHLQSSRRVSTSFRGMCCASEGYGELRTFYPGRPSSNNAMSVYPTHTYTHNQSREGVTWRKKGQKHQSTPPTHPPKINK